MNTTGERLVDDYLARLDAALAGIPSERRREIVEEVEAHLAAAVEAAPGDEIALREALDRLGSPEEIAAEARERPAPGAEAPPRRGGLETAAIVLLLVGGLLGGFGWLVGVVLLWMSDVWRVQDKLIGTLVLPGGLAFPAVLLLGAGISVGSGSSICSGESGGPTVCTSTGGTPGWEQALLVAAVILCVALPIATAVYLGRRSRPAPEPG